MSGPPLARGATRIPAQPRDDVAELLRQIENQRAEIQAHREHLLELVERVGALERASAVAAGERDDKARLESDLSTRVRRLESSTLPG